LENKIMRKVLKVILYVIGIFIIIFVLLPLIIPIPAVKGTEPASTFADSDSRFVEINGINVHYKQYGEGIPAIFLLHGFGASTFSWREVAPHLQNFGSVIAYDRPGFGLTDRPLPDSWLGENPYGTQGQVNMLIAFMDHFKVQKAILVGNSAGGTVALATALQHPDRVEGIVFVDAAIYQNSPVPEWAKVIMRSKQASRIGPLFLRGFGKSGEKVIYTAWHDPSKVTPETIEGYKTPLQVNNWDIGLWQFSSAPQISNLEARLNELKMPVLVATGDDDRIVPTELSVRLGKEIPESKFVLFKACGHVPQEECPDQFMNAIEPFITKIMEARQ
jgi:pimeloyl-ACP methyl ester carboxylesterase